MFKEIEAKKSVKLKGAFNTRSHMFYVRGAALSSKDVPNLLSFFFLRLILTKRRGKTSLEKLFWNNETKNNAREKKNSTEEMTVSFAFSQH